MIFELHSLYYNFFKNILVKFDVDIVAFFLVWHEIKHILMVGKSTNLFVTKRKG